MTGNSTEKWLLNHDVGVQFEAGNVTSKTMYARYYDQVNEQMWVFNQLSIVIVLKDGYVDEVYWDEGCDACPDSRCIQGNCAINTLDCNIGGENGCDFSLYVSWYGNDLKNRYLLTAGDRIGMFASSAKYYYNYVREQFDSDWVTFCELSSNTEGYYC